MVARLVVKDRVDRMISSLRNNRQLDREGAGVNIQLLIRAEAEAELLPGGVLWRAGIHPDSRLDLQNGRNQEVRLRRMRIDVEAVSDLEIQLNYRPLSSGDRVQLTYVQDVALRLGGLILRNKWLKTKQQPHAEYKPGQQSGRTHHSP